MLNLIKLSCRQLHIILIGMLLAYFASLGLRGYTLTFFATLSSLVFIGPLDKQILSSQLKSCFVVVLILGGISICCAVEYLFYRNYSVLGFYFSFHVAFSLGALLLYFRGRQARRADFFTLIISFVCGVLIFNLLIILEVPRDQILKEGLGGVVRSLTVQRGGVVYLGTFLIENHIIIPYSCAIGLSFCGAVICLEGVLTRLGVFAFGALSMFPAYYTNTRAPFFVFASVLLVLCFTSLWQRKNILMVAVISVSVLIVVLAAIARDYSLLLRFTDLGYGDGRFILWQEAIEKLLLSGNDLMISSYAHNYILDIGLDYGRGLALCVFILTAVIFVMLVRLFLKYHRLNFKSAFLLCFFLVGLMLSMVNPPSTMSHMVYGFGLASLPYFNFLNSILREPRLSLK